MSKVTIKVEQNRRRREDDRAEGRMNGIIRKQKKQQLVQKRRHSYANDYYLEEWNKSLRSAYKMWVKLRKDESAKQTMLETAKICGEMRKVEENSGTNSGLVITYTGVDHRLLIKGLCQKRRDLSWELLMERFSAQLSSKY